MLSSWELELRCLMNWKDFKCSWIMKSSERWRGEHSGRCARLADQEDLPALSARRRKDLPESPQRYKLETCPHRLHLPPSTVPGKGRAPRKLLPLMQGKGLQYVRVLWYDALIENQRLCLHYEPFLSQQDSRLVSSTWGWVQAPTYHSIPTS